MRKYIKMAVSILCFLIITAIMSSFCVIADSSVNDTTYNSYTYWETFEGTKKPVYCEDVYKPDFVIDANYLGEEEIGSISDICTDENNNIYVLDSKNSNIYILDSQYKLINVLYDFKSDNQSVFFENAQGIFCRHEKIYVCDTEGEKVLVADLNGNVLNTITLPDSPLIPSNFKFRPIRVTVDSNKYIYILCEGSYYGAILCSDDGKFLSFYGANLTETGFVSTVKKIWKKLTMTNERRSKSASSIPFQFQDIYIDAQDFVYTATGSGVKNAQVKKLSPGGSNVFIETNYNFADVNQTYYLTEEAIINRNPDIANIAVSDGYMYILDSTYGRVFLYDSECRLLSAFGGGIGYGDKLGSFVLADAIELNGEDVLVADKTKNSITVFKITEFGEKLKKARQMTIKGAYDESYGLWQEILAEDKNCQLAYIGLAKSEYSKGNYKLALKYSKVGQERDVYSKAFKHIRNDFLRRNFLYITVASILVIVLIICVVLVFKKKNINKRENKKISTACKLLLHPFENFQNIKYKGYGSSIIATCIIVVFYIMKVCETNFGGFIFSKSSDSNALFLFLRTFGFVLLWTVSNRLVTALNGGLGKIKEIYIVVSYSLMPMIIYSVLYVGFSNFFTAEEGGFLAIFSVITVMYSFILLLIGNMIIHDTGFGKTLLTFLFTLIFMAIIIFLLFIMVVLVQQLVVFVYNICSELLHY